MKLRTLTFPQILYRSFNPRWAHLPLSGQGAANSGGRFNAPGVHALYLSLELETSIAEYKQDAAHLQPCTLVSYQADLPPLVDIFQLDDTWGKKWNRWNCDWRLLHVEGLPVPSWELGKMVIEAKYSGIIFPSMARPGGSNVVLFTVNGNTFESMLKPIDPEGNLPKNQSSWT